MLREAQHDQDLKRILFSLNPSTCLSCGNVDFYSKGYIVAVCRWCLSSLPRIHDCYTLSIPSRMLPVQLEEEDGWLFLVRVTESIRDVSKIVPALDMGQPRSIMLVDASRSAVRQYD